MNEKNKMKVLYVSAFCTGFSYQILTLIPSSLCFLQNSVNAAKWPLLLLHLLLLFSFSLICSDLRTPELRNGVWHISIEKCRQSWNVKGTRGRNIERRGRFGGFFFFFTISWKLSPDQHLNNCRCNITGSNLSLSWLSFSIIRSISSSKWEPGMWVLRCSQWTVGSGRSL